MHALRGSILFGRSFAESLVHVSIVWRLLVEFDDEDQRVREGFGCGQAPPSYRRQLHPPVRLNHRYGSSRLPDPPIWDFPDLHDAGGFRCFGLGCAITGRVRRGYSAVLLVIGTTHGNTDREAGFGRAISQF